MNRIYMLFLLVGIVSSHDLFSQHEGQRSGPEFKETSILSSGKIYKISVAKTGIYKLDYNFFRDKLKADPVSLHPAEVKLFGNGDGKIPQWNAAKNIDDLEETSMYAVGMEDGKFDQEDYFIFYAEGPDQWSYSSTDRTYHMDKNIYDVVNHYYIVINATARVNIGARPNGTESQYDTDRSLSYQRLEEEKINLLGRYRPPGSGQEWYGDELAVVDELDYSGEFDLNNVIPTDTFYYKVRFAARAQSASRFYVYFNEHEISRSVGGVTLDNFEASFANDAVIQGFLKPVDAIHSVSIKYPGANGINSRAWIDYIEINAWQQNNYTSGKPLFINDPRTSYQGIPRYEIYNFPAGGFVWDISDPLKPVEQLYNVSGGEASFIATPSLGQVQQFIAFDPTRDLLTPEYEKEITNQNLHQVQTADLVIVYYDQYADAALKLAQHRRDHDHFEVLAVPVSQVFEEFGGGSWDPSAIRNFARMLYKRDPAFRYLLLMGDATYDYLGRFNELPKHNFIPAFETEESLDPIRSFPSDDYFGLLDDNEGEEGKTLIGALDIAVGRIPADTKEDALAVVDKIIHYETSATTLNDWRERVVMVADDEDGNTHLNQADGLANQNGTDHPEYNMNKIYLDAFPQEATPGGDRYPDVNDAIDLNMRKGALTVTYLGHGGQNGWTQERVLGINQAQSYDNYDNLPVFITATCSFAGYDEPSFTTAGEHLLTNPHGGAVGLMTTVRAVYSGSNERLTRAVLDRLYTPDGPGNFPGIGEILRRSKNIGVDSLDNNARKFTMLGDPSMRLAIPRYHVSVTEINGKPVSGTPDTLSALEKANLSGVVLDDQGGILTQFNGELSLTVFDKVQVRKTLANDEGSSVRTFNTQNRQLFKGKASVVGGHWTIEFVLPKDIDFSYGPGKFSFYAEDGNTDAGGYFNSFIIGGVSNEGQIDDQPPVVDLYMNDAYFKSGGMTDPDPYIYVELMDDFGINVSGTGVGHDIEAILDGDEKNGFILNDFYVASLDDYKKGIVRYPLNNLSKGKHTLRVTAWDLANNPGDAYIEFYVRDEAGIVIDKVMNYPNPFLDFTRFQFEHNRPGSVMDLKLMIYTVQGQLIRTVEEDGLLSDGYRVEALTWDGLSDGGKEVDKGLYVYKIKVDFNVNGTTESAESKAGKLVVLR